MGRIMGELEVSRAFGDFIHKNNGVCAIPNISRMVLEENTSALYNIILASDGLWDYVSCDKVNEVVKKFNSSGAIANELRRCAKEGRSKDNICVMAV